MKALQFILVKCGRYDLTGLAPLQGCLTKVVSFLAFPHSFRLPARPHTDAHSVAGLPILPRGMIKIELFLLFWLVFSAFQQADEE